VGKELGIKTVRAEIFPEDKARELKELKKRGPVCMVGDGINDAPALAEADVGMAVGRGVDIAIDSANVVLTAEGIIGVYNAIRLGRRTLRNIKMNLFWAFCYNIVGIPLAAGAFVSLLGWSMNPMFGAAAMSVSSFLVVTNALTLFWFKPKKANNYLQNQKKEKEKMEMVLKIEGMMCPHCSGRVKAALEALAGVAEAEVSHETGEARVTVNGGVLRETLVKTVEDAGYKVVG
jgi:Cu2+-exporting ATPase